VSSPEGDIRPLAAAYLAAEPVEGHQPAAHLEGADRRVVLMLDDHIRTEPFGKQLPAMRRRRRHRRADDAIESTVVDFCLAEVRKDEEALRASGAFGQHL